MEGAVDAEDGHAFAAACKARPLSVPQTTAVAGFTVALAVVASVAVVPDCERMVVPSVLLGGAGAPEEAGPAEVTCMLFPTSELLNVPEGHVKVVLPLLILHPSITTWASARAP